ncbi:hypothetical protein RchiOBHm_Chr6g0274571 [Rosa chinensis]|uniref:Uncharacterized protein n=1 Tax=Rosa chinensis TaxID=74649 RepID=A0A2P6PRT8_ROSCH|nr:hypothetical protein RchiOBHm_Chr6g0274571 [Rosa chinensis]
MYRLCQCNLHFLRTQTCDRANLEGSFYFVLHSIMEGMKSVYMNVVLYHIEKLLAGLALIWVHFVFLVVVVVLCIF